MTLCYVFLLTTGYWLLCNEIATARQVGPRNDKTKSLEFVEFIEFVGFIEIGDTDYWPLATVQRDCFGTVVPRNDGLPRRTLF
jgi:hypothetical protein